MTKAFQSFIKSDRIYSPDEIENVLTMIAPHLSTVRANKDVQYYDAQCSFDIETSSFRSTGNDEKVAVMYEWTLGLYGAVIIGRTWEDFVKVLTTIADTLRTNKRTRLIIYVHNLAYEFQFMRKWFGWDKVFAVDTRRPVYAITTTGIEFRCSYILSGYSLAKIGKDLQTFQIRKLTGSLDYKKIRHSETPLTDEEKAYCVNDVKVVMAYIAERIEQDGGLIHIPLTKTGYVRNYCRNACFYEPGVPRNQSFKRVRYMELMKRLTLTADEYKQLKRAFQGGFTHANPSIPEKSFMT